MLRSSLRRSTLVVGATAGALVLFAGAASAHVTVDPSQANRGDYAKLTFRVPDESDTASTTRVRVMFPPIPSVRVKPHPGWTVSVQKSKLPKPVDVGDFMLEEAVTSITWTAAEGAGIAPGEFDEFDVSVGPLPDKPSLSFPADQTYDNNKVVRWNQIPTAGAAEPEHPAPTLTLATAGAGGHHGTDPAASAAPTPTSPSVGAEQARAEGGSGADETPAASASDSTARALGAAGLAVGLLGLASAGYAALVLRRRDSR
jgi:uncharacterized protein YcnI